MKFMDWVAAVLFVLTMAFVVYMFLTRNRPPGQLPLPLLCVRCNGGPQGDLDCYLCGGTGLTTRITRRRGW